MAVSSTGDGGGDDDVGEGCTVGAGSLTVARGEMSTRDVVKGGRRVCGGGMPRVQPDAERVGVTTWTAKHEGLVKVMVMVWGRDVG